MAILLYWDTNISAASQTVQTFNKPEDRPNECDGKMTVTAKASFVKYTVCDLEEDLCNHLSCEFTNYN